LCTKLITIWRVSILNYDLPGKINCLYVWSAKQYLFFVSFIVIKPRLLVHNDRSQYTLRFRREDHRLPATQKRLSMTGIGEIREDVVSIIYFYFIISIVDKTAA